MSYDPKEGWRYCDRCDKPMPGDAPPPAVELLKLDHMRPILSPKGAHRWGRQ